MISSEHAAIRIAKLMKPGAGERRTFSTATIWKIPAVFRKFNTISSILKELK
jgi:hypothetical protein